MRYHHQNLTDGRLPLWRHGRAWWWRLAWEWSVLRRGCGWAVGLGRRTASVRLGWFAFYVHHRDADGFAPEWSVRLTEGSVWIEHPWVRQMEWLSSDPWWRKDIVLRVSQWLLGRWKCEVTKGQPSEVFVPLPEGCYRAVATPETYEWRRRFGITKRRECVDIKIPGGIPFRGKGENSWDCGDDGLWGTGGDTVEDAIANCVRSVLQRRSRYGHDSKGTGREPALVVGGER